ncbi:MAG: bifunctional diaminohydroxyphosphoribosylaminopyrimidine deaminase/5-amino-6-(5-phosphoribosylamino)uracil reductase RibD [Deltaproteobacteria bacterium]|nr:MAG: bifunctional diaminohydroxyphosphoribosylaminopyrimidine deaminase/5-amino-6-(5-phosphoribosylamino)uracil reductase RibD [Deltaproteobacteria bacterium]
MLEALVEAERGRGRTHPNPIVGALVVSGGRVIACGHHERAGGPHAEVVALEKAGARARGADLYVTLEPCNHHGRTPPCTDAILASGVRRVVVGSIDPNPLVHGRGIRRLRGAGVRVDPGVLGEECDRANEQWFKFITRKIPWVVLKAAVTLDGKLATRSGDSRWVTGPLARARVHELRDRLDAVLIGIGTALADDPRLTARGKGQRDPVRIVVDPRARLSPEARLLRQRSAAETIVAVTLAAPRERVRALEQSGATILRCRHDRKGRILLRDLLRRIAGRGLTTVLVEGGSRILGSFLRERSWDELFLFFAPKVLGEDALSWAGMPSPPSMGRALEVQIAELARLGPDLLVRARPLR